MYRCRSTSACEGLGQIVVWFYKIVFLPPMQQARWVVNTNTKESSIASVIFKITSKLTVLKLYLEFKTRSWVFKKLTLQYFYLAILPVATGLSFT
jgi:hypothetical protein